jgi:hypothetical protein
MGFKFENVGLKGRFKKKLNAEVTKTQRTQRAKCSTSLELGDGF